MDTALSTGHSKLDSFRLQEPFPKTLQPLAGLPIGQWSASSTNLHCPGGKQDREQWARGQGSSVAGSRILSTNPFPGPLAYLTVQVTAAQTP